MQLRMAVSRGVCPAPQTLAEFIKIHAAADSNAPALVIPDGRILTYSALFEQIERIGAVLRSNGIGARDRVAVAIADGPELAIAIVAISCHAVVVPLSVKATLAEAEDLFSSHRIDAALVPDEAQTTAREVAQHYGASLFAASYDREGIGLTIRSASPARQIDCVDDPVIDANNTAIILRTSGTTARPRLVAVTHANLVAMAMRLQGWFDLAQSDCVLCVTPLHYAQGLKNTLFVPLILGGSIACPLRTAAPSFFDWLTEFKPTWYSAGPTFHRSVLDAGKTLHKTKSFSHSLRFIHSAAAPLPESLHEELEAMFGVPVINSYGLTEAGLVAANSVAPEGRKRGTVGKFWSGELAIRAEGGCIAEKNCSGEIVVRGPGVMPGYIDDPKTNRTIFVEGWLRTGDLGRIDSDGFLVVEGRIKELINRGGEKIAPAEIDAALLRHPHVVEAAAFPVPHPRLGEDVAAAVTIEAGSAVTSLDLRRFLKTALAPFQLPRRIHIVAELPKGDTGKISRQHLSKMFGSRIVERPKGHWSSFLEGQIAEVWQRLLGSKAIGPDDDFFELGGDSLLAVRMLIELERLTGKVLPTTTLFEDATIRQLAKRFVDEDLGEDQGRLVEVQPGTGATPFIFIDGDYQGGGYYVLNLARFLGREWPFYSLRSHGSRSGHFDSIEEMAQDYMRTLDAAGLSEPYRLGGHCNGALIALELAHQLEGAGRKVELVAMVEPLSLNMRPGMRLLVRTLQAGLGLVTRDERRRQRKIGAAMASVWRFVLAVIRQPLPKQPLLQFMLWSALGSASGRLRKLWKSESNEKAVPPSSDPESKIVDLYLQRMSSYIPKPVRARLLCILTEEASVHSPEFAGEVWRNLVSENEVVVVPGDHLSCLSTHVEALASRLRESLGKLEFGEIKSQEKDAA
jgi:oxalate---CoA ligase